MRSPFCRLSNTSFSSQINFYAVKKSNHILGFFSELDSIIIPFSLEKYSSKTIFQI